MEMPIGTAYSDVNSGNPLCCFKTDATETGKTEYVILVINAGNMAKSLGIAESHIIDQDPGYEWTYLNGLDESVPVYISMVQKQGYADEYLSRQLGTTRSNNREDYADLSDEEYANFRVIETTGMGKGTLYRSSSPVNPYLNRNKKADDALLTAQIRTVINTSDNEATMKSFADYILTNYKDCDIIALDMSVDTQSRNFQDSLAEACRFIISHDGPYLIHCTEGKDRTGYVSAILECLMGADADEIVTDYMLSYYNFYGLEPGTEKYEQIAASNIDSILASIIGISSIREEGTDLQACAETYLQKIGLSAEEISALKDRLGKSYQ